MREAIAGTTLRADSDLDPLRAILLHRPGAELARVDAANAGDLLFDAPVDVAAAEREHEELCRALGGEGVEVLHLEDLVAGAEPVPPNLMFTRDLAVVIGDGVHVARMALPVRARETELVREALSRFDARRWSDGDVAVEGGDVLLAGDEVVVIGVGERTSLAAAHDLAERLFAGGAAREVVAVLLPSDGPFHLDLAMTFADRSTVVVDRPVIEASRALRLRPSRVPSSGAVLDVLERALDRELRVIEAADERHGRDWDRGTNLLAVRPGVVVAYADNVVTRRRLERAGIEVIPVPGVALGRGRGGPRCLSCPLVRG